MKDQRTSNGFGKCYVTLGDIPNIGRDDLRNRLIVSNTLESTGDCLSAARYIRLDHQLELFGTIVILRDFGTEQRLGGVGAYLPTLQSGQLHFSSLPLKLALVIDGIYILHDTIQLLLSFSVSNGALDLFFIFALDYFVPSLGELLPPRHGNCRARVDAFERLACMICDASHPATHCAGDEM